VTDQQIIYLLLFALVLGINLLAAASRASLEKTGSARLFQPGESREAQLARTAPVLSSQYFNRAGLFLLQILLHFAMAGLAALLIFPWIILPEARPWAAAIVVLSALLIAWLEWITFERASTNADAWSVRLTPVARILTAPLQPLLVLTLRVTPPSGSIDHRIETAFEEELKSLVDASQQEVHLEQDERKMIYSIFRLGDTLAREIMIPRIDVLSLDVETPLTDAVDTLLRTGFSRVPVYEETIDNILGVIYTKDLLRVWREGNQISSLQSLLRPAYFVPEAKKVDELLAEMQTRRVHMAVVVDEYGGVAGVVTLEDIVEEIVGEIQDEYDQAEELPYQQVGEGEFIFQGRVDLDDFNDVMGSYLPADEADTIGGFIYNRFGQVPNAGENIKINNLLLTVEQVSGRRIRKVRASWLPVEVEETKEETNADK
jgi:putative hemolysin